MNLKLFFWNLILSKLVPKFQMFAFVVFVASILGYSPDWSGVVGFLLFFTAYLSTYFYNDLVDIRDDKRKAVYPAKLLARGWATRSEYFFLSANLFALGTLLATIYDPILGAVAFLAVFLNNIRSYVRGIFLRQSLLVIVELLNFMAVWISIYGGFPSLLAFVVLLDYCLFYALGHIIYKVRRPLGEALMRPDALPFTVLAFALFFPSAYALFRHWAGFVFGMGGVLLYTVPQHLRVQGEDLNDQRLVDDVFWRHILLMGVTGLWYLAGALIVLY